MNEKWLPIVGFDGTYEVSDFGRVRSTDRIVRNKSGTGTQLQGKIISVCFNVHGYRRFSLSKDGKKKIYLASRLVALAFFGVPDAEMQVDHINRNRSDDRLENLRWITQTNNCWNRSVPICSTSGTTGVNWNIKKGKWVSRITCNGRRLNLGNFDSKDAAIAVRKAAEKEYFGKFRADAELENKFLT